MVACGGTDLVSAADIINCETDVKAFIAGNRTGNPYFQREEFHGAPDLQVLGRQVRLDSLAAMRNTIKKSEHQEEDASKKKVSLVERALMGAWGSNVADEEDEEAEQERELAIQEELMS
jgi:hypothetical protein